MLELAVPKNMQLLSQTYRYDFHIPLFHHLGCLHTIIFKAHIETKNCQSFDMLDDTNSIVHRLHENKNNIVISFFALNTTFNYQVNRVYKNDGTYHEVI